MTTKRINQAIKHLGLQIIKGNGYAYFVDHKGQVGNSVMVCYLNQLTLDRWVQLAKSALEN